MRSRRGGRARDTISISGLAVETRLGVTAAERAVPQTVRISVSMGVDCTRAAKTDSLRHTVDWSHLAERIRRVAGARERHLAETLASDVCTVVLSEERVAEAVVAVSKDGAKLPGADSLEAVVRRRRTRALPPFAPFSDRAAATAVRARGSAVKAAGRAFHAFAPAKRFRIPEIAPPVSPCDAPATPGGIPRIAWITNFTADCTLPVWKNYVRNRRMAPTFEFRFVGDAAMDRYIRENAPERAVKAWNRLENGAARADFWRVFALLREGGVYLDMDAAIVRPLERSLGNRPFALLWDRRRFSNFFMATSPGQPLFAEFFDAIVRNVESTPSDAQPPVFYVTGPGALETVLDGKTGLEYSPHLGLCIQGAFTNERFQYADRPGSKWTRNPDFLRPGT